MSITACTSQTFKVATQTHKGQRSFRHMEQSMVVHEKLQPGMAPAHNSSFLQVQEHTGPSLSWAGRLDAFCNQSVASTCHVCFQLPHEPEQQDIFNISCIDHMTAINKRTEQIIIEYFPTKEHGFPAKTAISTIETSIWEAQ